jgi:hypothetical protein
MADDPTTAPLGPEDLTASGPDPLSGESLRERLRDILSREGLDDDAAMKAIVTAVTKLGIDIGVRRSGLPYPLSPEDRVDRMKTLLGSLPEEELAEIRGWLEKSQSPPISPVPLEQAPS